MPKYEVGITEINVLVRRLGYVSAILGLLEHKTLSESVLYTQLEKWSLNHEQDLMALRESAGIYQSDTRANCPKALYEFRCFVGDL